MRLPLLPAKHTGTRRRARGSGQSCQTSKQTLPPPLLLPLPVACVEAREWEVHVSLSTRKRCLRRKGTDMPPCRSGRTIAHRQERFMNERQREYFRNKLLASKEDIL